MKNPKDTQEEKKSIYPEFKPDERKLFKIALFRRVTICVTIVLLAATFLWLLLFPQKKPSEGFSVKQSYHPPQEESPLIPSQSKETGKERSTELTLTKALSIGRSIDSLTSYCITQWEIIERQMDIGTPLKEKLPEITEGLNKIQAIEDNIRKNLKIVQGELVVKLKEMGGEAGLVGFKINSIYIAAQGYLNLLLEEEKERSAYINAWEKALKALDERNEAEFEIQQNVANSYLRKCLVRKRKIFRAQNRLKETLKIYS